MASIISNLFRFASRSFPQQIPVSRQFHALPTSISSNKILAPIQTNPWSFDSIRTIVRNRFPKPSENKRIKVHGWKTRLSTKNGRRTIMRRILKGKYVLSH